MRQWYSIYQPVVYHFLQEGGMKLEHTTPYSPQQNPTGGANQTVKTMIAQFIDEHLGPVIARNNSRREQQRFGHDGFQPSVPRNGTRTAVTWSALRRSDIRYRTESSNPSTEGEVASPNISGHQGKRNSGIRGAEPSSQPPTP